MGVEEKQITRTEDALILPKAVMNEHVIFGLPLVSAKCGFTFHILTGMSLLEMVYKRVVCGVNEVFLCPVP